MPKQEKESGVFDFLKLGESYTSLILGIVVVIVSTVLLLSFVHNKNKATTPNQRTQVATAPTATPTPSKESSVTIMLTPSVAPTKAAKKPTPTVAKVAKKYDAQTVTPTVAKKKKPTAVPTKVVKAPTKAPTAVPTKVVAKKVDTKVQSKGTYTVAKGDNLWIIAEKNYKSGYNWVDIARANKLNDPNNIHVGTKLVLPKVESKVATVVEPTKPVVKPTKAIAKVTPTPKQVAKVTPTPVKVAVQPNMQKITGTKYTVVQGDNLWNIAVRAYADGYQWVKIATANNLANPNIIHPGNVLTLPRK